MSLLAQHLAPHARWTTDGGHNTPQGFSDPEKEWQSLLHGAALIDFSHGGSLLVDGPDSLDFLSGIITNQIRAATDERAIYAALLTAQGRFLWDFTVVRRPSFWAADAAPGFLLLTEPGRAAPLQARLSMYQLRSKVQISEQSGAYGLLGVAGPGSHAVIASLFPAMAPRLDELGAHIALAEEEILLWRDPRHLALGWRLLAPAARLPALWDRLNTAATPVGWPIWEHFRIQQAIPRSGHELIPETTLLLEAGMLEMHAVDFSKGCYIGQETTTRTHHRGTVKKRLFQLLCPPEARLPIPTPLLTPQGGEAGLVTSFSHLLGESLALAVVRSAAAADHPTMSAADIPVTLHKPDWSQWE